MTGRLKVQSVPLPTGVALPWSLPSRYHWTCAARVSAVALKLTLVTVVDERTGAAGLGKLGLVATSALTEGPSAPRPETRMTWRRCRVFWLPSCHATSTVSFWKSWGEASPVPDGATLEQKVAPLWEPMPSFGSSSAQTSSVTV